MKRLMSWSATVCCVVLGVFLTLVFAADPPRLSKEDLRAMLGNSDLVIIDDRTGAVVGYELAPQKEIEEILRRVLEQGEGSLAFVPYIHQFPLHQLKGKWTGPK